ncbi:hypothetical protein [Ruminococcus bicirculans (ex Wegman et al. 2014)]|uniref:hypothetical protein n=1 Tax=Ruminococcus bicirculans (ex Wegman et al. 2014) TaxID=1160721 RepID=UPI003FD6E5C0
MATDIIARGMAANAKKSVTELGNKIESEKWIGTKAEWEAVDKSTIKDGTIVYITDDETVILYDKAEMEKIAAQVAADRKAAETAAQTAQAVADSLPEDYTTAVGKIAENTAEIGRVKLTDNELQRRVNALYSIGQGITHQFETDSETAYQKTVPTGGKLMSVKSVGGHSEVIDGEIVSAGTESIIEQGANLCDPTIFSTAYPEFITVKDNIIDVFSGGQAMFGTGVALKIPQGYSMTFTPVSKGNMATNGRIRALFSDGDSSDIAYITDGNSLPKSTTNYVVKKDISAIAFNWSDLKSGYAFKMQITQNATNSFAPYHSNVYQIPEAIKALPGYGWSAGTARNYVDYENKKYYQCVGSVDLGTLTWTAGESVSFKTHHLAGQKLTKSYSIAPNFICPKYSTKTQNESWGKTSITGISATSNVNGYIYVNDTSYTDATAFKQAMQGVILYYELANPIVTDISTMLTDDFLRNLTVEAGGSITFKGGNDDYRIPVPSEEEYVVKLSEVGGTT